MVGEIQYKCLDSIPGRTVKSALPLEVAGMRCLGEWLPGQCSEHSLKRTGESQKLKVAAKAGSDRHKSKSKLHKSTSCSVCIRNTTVPSRSKENAGRECMGE
jgi:hypothetical protein